MEISGKTADIGDLVKNDDERLPH